MQLTLEQELRLPSSDLRSHGWYHGGINRSESEALLSEEGQFLVRDCLSQPNDFVLSCQTSTSKLHFIINRVFLLPNTLYERIQYQLEDDLFDTIADLVTFYVGNKRTITQRSGALITKPVLRTKSLTSSRAASGNDGQPPPKPGRNYCDVSKKRRDLILRKEYSRIPFISVEDCINKTGSDSFLEFPNDQTDDDFVVHTEPLRNVQNQLRSSGSRVLARSLGLIDIRMLRLDQNRSSERNAAEETNNQNEFRLPLGAQSALETLTLPHGDFLHVILKERCEYLKLLVIATIVHTEGREECLEMLTKWIQVASEVKFSVGDLLGFQCIMMGLTSEPITSLKALWLEVRRQNTELALLFETKLRQELAAQMDRCDMAPNTCVPNVYHYVGLLRQFGTEGVEKIILEKSGSDHGLAFLLTQLENLRLIVAQTERFARNAAILQGSSSTLDRQFEFFETSYLIGIFNTAKYEGYSEPQKCKRQQQILHELQTYATQKTSKLFPDE